MVVLVPYNLSEIQKGIQAAHAIAEYGFYHPTDKYCEWVTDYKTIIILNGGTTGTNSTMNQYMVDLDKLGVTYKVFQEPDLNDAITGIAFIVDTEEDSHIDGYLRQFKLA